MRESQLEEIRRRQYAASLASKDKLAGEIEEITNKIEKIQSQLSAIRPCADELEQTMVASSDPLLFLLNNDKSERISAYYHICDELLDGTELENARRRVSAELNDSVFNSVSILPNVFPKEDLNNQSAVAWNKSLVELGWRLLLLLRLSSDPAEAAEILEKLKIVEGFATRIPIEKYPLSHLKPMCEYMLESQLPEIRIYSVGKEDKSVFDYKNIIETKLISAHECSIQIVIGIIAFIHLAYKQKSLQDLEPYWADLQSRINKLPVRIVNPDAHLSPFAAPDSEGLVVGGTDLSTYLQTHHLIGWRSSMFVWILLFPFIAIKRRPIFASIIFIFLAVCVSTAVHVILYMLGAIKN